MSKYLIACYPIAGHLHPNIALAEALIKHGHEVSVYSGAKAETALASVGLRHFRYHPQMDEIIDAILLPTPSKDFSTANISTTRFPLLHRKKINTHLRRWFVDTVPHQISDITTIIDEWAPDVIISDISLFGPTLFLSEIASIPTAIFSVIPACSIPGPDAPTWGRGLPAPRTSLARLRYLLENKLKHFFLSEFRHGLNKMRDQYGLAPIHSPAMEYIRRLPLYLIVGTPEFDYSRRDLPTSVHYVGPCLWHRPNHEQPPDWISNLPLQQPVIYVTEGTIHVKKPFLLETAAAALCGENVHVVMTTAKHRSPADIAIDMASRNIRIEKYVSHGDLFPHVTIVITTGGTGTILSALLLGIPLIVVPTGWDLPENAQRVVESGAGIRLEPKDCTEENLRAAVFEILNTATYRQNAERLGRSLATIGGPKRAVDLLETRLSSQAN